MITWVALVLALLGLYLYHVNRAMKQIPEEFHKSSSDRWTVEDVQAAYKKSLESPVDISKSIPPKQSRRYVVVGGAGLVGGWIVSHLLTRGEDPTAIRILDLLSPTEDILDLGVDYIKTNITDNLAVTTAFERSWPERVGHLPLTVYHTAALIRPADRLECFLPLSTKVNIDGTRNVLNAARDAGATCFISTSSGSVSLHRPTFWVPPWEKLPRRIVQVLSDEAKIPSRHADFFGNYAVTKIEAERIVRDADDPRSNFRTGCIRPANGIYGVGSDASTTITGMYLRTGGNPTWTRHIIQSFVNAENVSIAHLLYEQRLLEQSRPSSTLPNTGGQAFVVTDPNPPIAFEDIYLLLGALAATPISFPDVQPIWLFLLAYLVEAYMFARFKYLGWLLPPIKGDLAQVQPSLFAISDVFCVADDSRARKGPEQGGLGYRPPISTLEGMCRQCVDWNRKAEAKRVSVARKIGPVAVTEDGVDLNLVVPERTF